MHSDHCKRLRRGAISFCADAYAGQARGAGAEAHRDCRKHRARWQGTRAAQHQDRDRRVEDCRR